MATLLLLAFLFTFSFCHEGCIHDRLVRNQKLIPINDSYQ